LSFILTVKLKECIQGIGFAIGGVNEQVWLFRRHFSSLVESFSTSGNIKGKKEKNVAI
jgi:hypothetical protein